MDPCGPWLGAPALEAAAALPGVVKRPPDSWSGETQVQQTPCKERYKSPVACQVPQCNPLCEALAMRLILKFKVGHNSPV